MREVGTAGGPIARLAAVAATVAALAGALACGDVDEAEREQVRRAFTALAERLAARDVAGACRHITVAAGRQLTLVGHGDPTTCEADLRSYLASVDGAASMSVGVDPRVASVEIRGDEALVTARFDGGSESVYPYVREDGRWRLDSMFGVTAPPPSGLGDPAKGITLLDAADVTGPATAATPVAASADAAGCPDISTAGTEASGGCVLYARRTEFAMRLRTPAAAGVLGDECALSVTLLIDGEGRVAIAEAVVSRLMAGGPCNDIRQCTEIVGSGEEREIRKIPWLGHVTAMSGGAAEIELSVCLDTCAGRLQGRTEMSLSRGPRGWRLVAAGADVGRSGLELSGIWRLEGDPVEIDAAA